MSNKNITKEQIKAYLQANQQHFLETDENGYAYYNWTLAAEDAYDHFNPSGPLEVDELYFDLAADLNDVLEGVAA